MTYDVVSAAGSNIGHMQAVYRIIFQELDSMVVGQRDSIGWKRVRQELGQTYMKLAKCNISAMGLFELFKSKLLLFQSHVNLFKMHRVINVIPVVIVICSIGLPWWLATMKVVKVIDSALYVFNNQTPMVVSQDLWQASIPIVHHLLCTDLITEVLLVAISVCFLQWAMKLFIQFCIEVTSQTLGFNVIEKVLVPMHLWKIKCNSSSLCVLLVVIQVRRKDHMLKFCHKSHCHKQWKCRKLSTASRNSFVSMNLEACPHT